MRIFTFSSGALFCFSQRFSIALPQTEGVRYPGQLMSARGLGQATSTSILAVWVPVGIACRVTFYTTEESHTLWCDSSIIAQDVLFIYRTPSEPAFSLSLYTVFLPTPSVSRISSLIISPRISFARVSFTPSKSANTLLDAETWTVR